MTALGEVAVQLAGTAKMTSRSLGGGGQEKKMEEGGEKEEGGGQEKKRGRGGHCALAPSDSMRALSGLAVHPAGTAIATSRCPGGEEEKEGGRGGGPNRRSGQTSGMQERCPRSMAEIPCIASLSESHVEVDWEGVLADVALDLLLD
ncbi:unnamed protein product [Prorocentrum cordatum]|uniref:Uncharacterized protein n=1 Tax=Prorocentrum cordatum TaxID=2364126 RepID=A0ABN9VIU5_9DINO|nr:unnamed protein product [Polarella glacialis]